MRFKTSTEVLLMILVNLTPLSAYAQFDALLKGLRDAAKELEKGMQQNQSDQQQPQNQAVQPQTQQQPT